MTVTVVPTYEAATSNVPPRVRLNVTASGAGAPTAVTVTRLDPDGRLTPVRTATGDAQPLSASTAILYDYEPWYNAPTFYTSVEDPGTMSSAVTVPVTDPWLIHPGVPTLSRRIKVAEFGARTRSVSRGVYAVMGRDTAVVHTDGARKKPESTVVLNTTTLQELADLEALMADGSPLLLNVPASLGWGIEPCYISVGDLTEDRVLEYAPEPRRTWTLPYVVVRRPAGGSQATRTYTDILIDHATYADVRTSYATYLALLAGD